MFKATQRTPQELAASLHYAFIVDPCSLAERQRFQTNFEHERLYREALVLTVLRGMVARGTLWADALAAYIVIIKDKWDESRLDVLRAASNKLVQLFESDTDASLWARSWLVEGGSPSGEKEEALAAYRWSASLRAALAACESVSLIPGLQKV